MSEKTPESILAGPNLVRQRWLPTEIAVQEVVAFERRFGAPHLWLASHVALPLILTPELVNLIRINFLDEDTPWIAESDFLLSPLCRPIDEGMFEVEPGMREVLLVELENQFGTQRPLEIADFLLTYLHERPNQTRRPDVAQTQQWIGFAYINPDQALKDMRAFLEASLSQEISTGADVSKHIQFVSTLEIVKTPLGQTSVQTDYQYILNNSQVLAQMLYGDKQESQKAIQYSQLGGTGKLHAILTNPPVEILDRLLNILAQQISPFELRELIDSTLGPGAYDKLSGSTHTQKSISFLEEVSRMERRNALIQELATIKPGIDLSFFGIPRHEAIPIIEPEPMPFLTFVDRKVEWERVVLHPTGQYYLFDGPAGYGKTALLRKLEEEFKQRNWLCVYTSLETHSTLPEIAAHLAQELQVQCNVHVNAYQSGIELGEAIASQRHTEAGLALLFDVDHAPSKTLQATLTELLRDCVTGIWNALLIDSEFFRNTSVNYRVVLVGRYLAPEIDRLNLPYKFDVVRLTPFDYQVVQDVCANDLKDKLSDPQRRDEFAAHLSFYTGGHPRCMVSTLQLFKKGHLSPDEFFTRRREAIEQIAYTETDWVRGSMGRMWRSALDALCLYRRFDSELVKQLIEQGVIWQEGLGKDAYDVINNLLRFYLVDWRIDSAYRHLSDDITRRLLAIRLRYDIAPGTFSDLCYQVRQVCLNRLNAPGELHHIWAVEALFSYLQANVAVINELSNRQALRQKFFADELPMVLNLLTKDQSVHSECATLKRFLAHDWEFRFTVNYYLRDVVYTDDVYRALWQYIEEFPATVGVPMPETPSISPKLYQDLQTVLLHCGPFQNDNTLREIFIDSRINAWRDGLPSTNSASERVQVVIDYLLPRASLSGENALVLLLQVLRDQTSRDDACYGRFETLAMELTPSLSSVLKIYPENEGKPHQPGGGDQWFSRLTVESTRPINKCEAKVHRVKHINGPNDNHGEPLPEFTPSHLSWAKEQGLFDPITLRPGREEFLDLTWRADDPPIPKDELRIASSLDIGKGRKTTSNDWGVRQDFIRLKPGYYLFTIRLFAEGYIDWIERTYRLHWPGIGQEKNIRLVEVTNTRSLLDRLKQQLLKCDEFHNPRVLDTVMRSALLVSWQPNFPTADTVHERVDSTISYLAEKRHSNGESALVLLLQVLAERQTPQDQYRKELLDLVDELRGNTLLNFFQSQIGPEELRILIHKFLGISTLDNLSGNTHIERRISFLGEIERRQKNAELVTTLAENYPDIKLLLQISPAIESSVEINPDTKPRDETIDKDSTKNPQPRRRISEPSPLTWLHLSDLHFRESRNYDEPIVLKELLHDVAERIEKDGLRPDFIVVTGDIAFSGKPEEYKLAGSFFDKLLETAKLSRERLFVVPGNHDVNRSLISNGAKAITNALVDRDNTNAILADADDLKSIMKRFTGYAEFVNSYFGGHGNFNDKQYFYVRSLISPGPRVMLLGLNSAWVCASDNDKTPGVLIGERQARAALEMAESGDLKIALLHHPIDWLREFDQNDSAAMLLDQCDFILHGHLHRTATTQLSTPAARAMVIGGGACYETRQYPNMYNFVRLDLKTKTGTVYLRRYFDERGGFWAKDAMTYRNAQDGEYEFRVSQQQHRPR